MSLPMLRPGDIVEVHDLNSGGCYEAIVRWIPDLGSIRCEWIAGPNDGEDVWIDKEKSEL